MFIIDEAKIPGGFRTAYQRPKGPDSYRQRKAVYDQAVKAYYAAMGQRPQPDFPEGVYLNDVGTVRSRRVSKTVSPFNRREEITVGKLYFAVLAGGAPAAKPGSQKPGYLMYDPSTGEAQGLTKEDFAALRRDADIRLSDEMDIVWTRRHDLEPMRDRERQDRELEARREALPEIVKLVARSLKWDPLEVKRIGTAEDRNGRVRVYEVEDVYGHMKYATQDSPRSPRPSGINAFHYNGGTLDGLKEMMRKYRVDIDLDSFETVYDKNAGTV